MKLVKLTMVTALVAAMCAQASFAALGRAAKDEINDALIECSDDARAPGKLKPGVQTARLTHPGPAGDKVIEATQTGAIAQ